DAEALRDIPGVKALVPERGFPQEMRHGEHGHTGRVVGTTPAYADLHGLRPASGRFLVEEDEKEMTNVVVLGAAVARALFPNSEAEGESVRVGNIVFRVAGVLPERTGFDSEVYLPLSTMRARFGDRVVLRTGGSRSAEQVELTQVTLVLETKKQMRSVAEAA